MKPSIFIVLIVSLNISFAQKPIVATSKLESATVYFSGVELSHSAQVMIPEGSSECVIKNISNAIFESSMQISVPKNINILSTSYRLNSLPNDENLSVEMLNLKDSIQLINNELRLIQQSMNADGKILKILDQNTAVLGTESGLQTAELIKLIDYNKSKRLEIENNMITYEGKMSKLNTKLANLEKRFTNLKNQNSVSGQGEIVLQLYNKGSKSLSNIAVKYLCPNATWNPMYDIRAENILQPITLVYKANVSQNSGLDWKNIKLSLSSGIPNQSNETPILRAWHLNFMQQFYANYQRAFQQNTIPSVAKMKEEVFAQDGVGIQDDLITINDNQLNIGFDFDVPYDIVSDGQGHTLAIKEIKIPATFKHYTVPKIQKDVFLLAEIGDYAEYNLLPGEANIIFDNVYTGKTFLNPYQANDTLNINMGRDPKVVVKKEKMTDQSSTKIFSSNKVQVLTYLITVKNNKTEKISLTLKDQSPISDNSEITVELMEFDKATINSETGILTWLQEIEPNQSRKYRISYKVKYPKDKIVNL